ncbi:MAG: hypothetical protein AAGA43_07540 [Bacteroidota bacterium]
MKKCFLLLVLAVVFACSSDADQPEPSPTPNPPTQGEEDTTAPTVSITGLQDLIEVLTTLEVTVTDASNNVNTAILVNGEEVFTTTLKSFSYELDPFDFPTGETTITVQSTDDSDNQGTESGTFELKKLLFRSTDLAGDDPSNDFVDLYIAINSEETGELIASRLMQSFEDATFYAPEDFTREKIVATKYVLGKGTFFTLNVASTFASLEPGINVMTVEEAISTLGLNREPSIRDGQFDLSITDRPVNTNFRVNTSIDYGVNGGPSDFDFSYDIQNTENIFIHTSTVDRSINDYRYLILNNFEDQTISFNSFNSLASDKIQTNSLPNGTERYRFELRGFVGNEEFETDSYRLLYDFFENSGLGANATFSFPLIDDFEIFQQRLTVNLNDGREIFGSFRGLKEFEIPNLSISAIDDIVTVNGDYDSHTLIQDITGPIPQGFSEPILFVRRYVDDNSTTITIPFDALEIPTKIIENLTTKGFSINATNNAGDLSIAFTKREREINYQDLIFYFITRNEAGDEYQVTFPLD